MTGEIENGNVSEECEYCKGEGGGCSACEPNKMLTAINKYCLEQMKASCERPDTYNQGLWLVAEKLHGFIIRTLADDMNNLSIIDEVLE